MLTGIIASLLGAIGQAFNYAVTKDCQIKYGISGFNLLAATFIYMALLLTVPLVVMGYWRYFETEHILYLIRTNVPFLLAQYFMFCALRVSDASIVSPLLALKIPVLCFISLLIWGQSLSVQQYAAVALIIGVAVWFSALSGRIRPKALIFVVLSTTCYVLSDIGITSMAKTIPVSSGIEQVLITTCINYVAAGLFFVPFCPLRHIKPVDLLHVSLPSLTWIASATLCVVGFNLSGLVSGTILQSLRGVFGVVITFIFYRDEIMGSLSRGTFFTKVALSVAMVLFVVLFYL